MLPRLILVFLVALAGCVKTIPVDLSGMSTRKADTAMISELDYQVGHDVVSWYLIDSVDGTKVDITKIDKDNAGRAAVEVSPGVRKLVVGAKMSGPNYAYTFVTLNASVEAGKKYRIKGITKENVFCVWLVDSENGMQVAPQVTGVFTLLPQQPRGVAPDLISRIILGLIFRGRN
jgi:hypothetical protein